MLAIDTPTKEKVTSTISINGNPDGNGFASNINVKDETSAARGRVTSMSRVKLNRYSRRTINAEKEAVSPGC